MSYNQQLKFNFSGLNEKRLIKEVTTKYYEFIDEDGERKISKITNEKKWFDDSESNHNPTSSYHSEVI